MTRQVSRRRFFALAAAGAAAPALAGCSTGSASGASAASNGTVTISAMGMPQTTFPKQRKHYLSRLAQFQKANPGIKVNPSDAVWNPQTFSAQLAGGTAATVLTVPMTEPPGMIQRGQVADISAAVKALPVFSSYDPRVIATASQGGKVYGLPYDAYSLGMFYNRELFTKAGLDPSSPPVTWEEVRAAAKAITKATGVRGFAAMTTDNDGGWHLTAETYSRGGRMERKQGSRWVPAFDAAPTKDQLRLFDEMRWTDKTMGTDELLSQDDAYKVFGSGQSGMIISAPDGYSAYAITYKGNPKNLGVAAMPQGGGNATLLGGTVAMINAKASPAEIAAAIKYIDYMNLRPQYSPTLAAANAKSKAADGQPVGIPTVSIFKGATAAKVAAAIKPYINVPQSIFAPYIKDDAKLDYVVEPPVAAQNLYADLDNVMQAVLTQNGTNINSALSAADTQVSALLVRSQ